MLSKIFFQIFFYGLLMVHGCKRAPERRTTTKIPGDNGYQIKIDGNPNFYSSGKVYTLYLMGSRDFYKIQHFKRFIITVETHNGSLNPAHVGNFQLFGDALTEFNEECVNTLSETNDLPKTEVFFMWTAPAPPAQDCVIFRAMVQEDSHRWYADDGGLTKIFCPKPANQIAQNECCACDEAKYNMIFEGLWSKHTHPKDFPFSLWLTHFSDVIGASHEHNFTFWGAGQYSSEGLRSVAEWGSVRLMETELKAKSRFLRTIIKAAGLWYPNVNTNTSANFRVDRRHPLVSLVSMLGPSPDWIVGVDSLNLCLTNCTWIDDVILDLYPYDAGTDSGISYMSPNAETKPREKIYRITTTYPEDPRAPFYNPQTREMPALARLYLKKIKTTPKNCDDNFLTAQLDISENTEDNTRAECQVTDYTEWSECSVTCGKGLRMRNRQYVLPEKAAMFKCNRQLISKEMCVAAVPECGAEGAVSAESEEQIEDLTPDTGEGVCETSPWSPYSECSTTCGVGFRMRTRIFIDKMGNKKCPHVQIVEKEKCMMPECRGVHREVQDPDCPLTDWSDWSPCSASCGQGTRTRTRLLLNVNPDCKRKNLELVQRSPCHLLPNCKLDSATARRVCMEDKETGTCFGYFKRWYFDSKEGVCLQFIFGGCRGNRNNFATFNECMDSCKVVRGVQRKPVDCVVSDWSNWSVCNVSCGDGFMEKFRYIQKPAENGGKPCPNRLIKKRKCSNIC